MKDTWRKLIAEAMEPHGETFADLVAISLSDAELDAQFDGGFGSEEGAPFCAWTKNRVYFPLCYDGSEWVGSASRNPDGKPLKHQGG